MYLMYQFYYYKERDMHQFLAHQTAPAKLVPGELDQTQKDYAQTSYNCTSSPSTDQKLKESIYRKIA